MCVCVLATYCYPKFDDDSNTLIMHCNVYLFFIQFCCPLVSISITISLLCNVWFDILINSFIKKK